jgi:alpha-L-rhamnosidase
MAATCQIGRISVERYASAFGIQHSAPRISWRFEGDAVDWRQASYDLRLEGPNRQPEVFQGDSEASVLVEWPFSPLQSRERVTLHVRATSTAVMATDWATLNVEAGLLDRSNWSAALTLAGPQLADAPKRPVLLRKRFVLPTSFTTARLYSTALGLYEVSINGTVVGDHVLSPGWQSYKYRLHYQAFDISEYLRPGNNELVAWVAEGWYAGRLGWGEGRRNVYGSEPGLVAQVEVDGQALILTGDDGWEWAFGPLVSSELYDGEIVDLNSPVGPWQPARGASLPSVSLIAPESPPVRRKRVITAVEHLVSPSGASIIDFGQNLVGWIRIRKTPPSNTTLVFRHAEVLEHQELGVRPLRHAKATDSVRVGQGPAALGWEPKFTFHGFRYVQVDGWPNLDKDCIEAVVVHTDMERLGDFACSHSWLTRFHENTLWGLRGNFVSVPTDCPQRDERLGWTGDLQVGCLQSASLKAGILPDSQLPVRHGRNDQPLAPGSCAGAA